MVTLDRKVFQNCYYRCLSEHFIIFLLVTQIMMDSKRQQMHRIILLSVILHHVHYCHPNFKNFSARYKVFCGCECCISTKSIHLSLLSCHDRYLKKLKYQSQNEGLVKNQISYMKHIKIESCHMGVIFMPKHMIWKRQYLCISTVISCVITLEICIAMWCQMSMC